jgi:type II secretory pathway component PulC
MDEIARKKKCHDIVAECIRFACSDLEEGQIALLIQNTRITSKKHIDEMSEMLEFMSEFELKLLILNTMNIFIHDND